MKEQIFEALLKAICRRTGLPCVRVDESCQAEWKLGDNRLLITLSPSASSVTVRGYSATTGSDLADISVSILDQDAVVNGVTFVAERLMAA